MKRMLMVAVATITLLGMPLLTPADNWPQWRGPTGAGASAEKDVPTTWAADKNVAWKLPLPGMGGSTPIVWADRIFLTSEEKADLVLLCISTAGKELWKRKIGTGTGRKVREDEGNGASATPSTDGQHVWAMVGTGELACFDFDGNEVWKFNTQDRYGRFRIQFGMHSTPVLDGDRLYLQLIHSGGAFVVALDKLTGKEIWQIKRPSDCEAECEHSYASPCVFRNGNQAFLVVHGNDYATGHSLDDGKELWRVGDLNPKDRYNRTLRFVASPAASSDLIVVPSAKNGPVVGVKPSASGQFGVGSPHEQWRLTRDTPDVPSPLIHDGLVYLCNERGTLLCVDAKTGELYYKERIAPGRYRASPVYANGRVYCTCRDGTVTVVEFGRRFKVLETNNLPDQIAASPAIANGRIYLRGFDSLWAVATGGN